MHKRLVATTALVIILTVSHNVLAEELIAEQDKTLLVKYSDGTNEKHIVRYQAFFDQSHYQTGAPSTLTHPVDNRQCHWTTHTWVKRDIGIVDHDGHTNWRNEWSTIFDQPITTRAPGLGIKTGFQGVNCNSSAGAMATDANQAQAEVKTRMPTIMQGDDSTVVAALQGDAQVVSISPGQ